jgi:hypothetical protein
MKHTIIPEYPSQEGSRRNAACINYNSLKAAGGTEAAAGTRDHYPRQIVTHLSGPHPCKRVWPT